MEHLYPLVGGAERAMDVLYRGLAAKPDVEISYICKSNYTDDAMKAVAASDIVVTQLNWGSRIVEATKLQGKKSVFFVHSSESLCRVADVLEIASYCGQLCRHCLYREKFKIRPDLIVANSRYTQRFLLEQHELASEIVYPCVDVLGVQTISSQRRFITMNQLSLHKGADIFLSIARKMPQLSFRIVGYQSWEPEEGLPSNCHFAGVKDPREYLSDTSIFLAPARFKETFGRAIVEARANAIPVIASARGGALVDELVPKHLLVDDIDDVDLWVEKIRGVLANYNAESDIAGDMDFTPYSIEPNVERFYGLLKGLLYGAPIQLSENPSENRSRP